MDVRRWARVAFSGFATGVAVGICLMTVAAIAKAWFEDSLGVWVALNLVARIVWPSRWFLAIVPPGEEFASKHVPTYVLAVVVNGLLYSVVFVGVRAMWGMTGQVVAKMRGRAGTS